MRIQFALTVLLAGLFSGPFVHADNELFSEVAMESVFEPRKEKATISDQDENAAVRITGLTTLEKSLKNGGYKPTKNNKFVSVDMQYAGLNLTFYLSVAVQRDQLLLELPVVKIADSDQADSGKLLELLSVTDSARQIYFAFDKAEKMIELRRTISNRNVTPFDLKTSLEEMAELAEKHSDAWSALKSDARKSTKTEIASQSPALPSSNATKSTTTAGSAKPAAKLSLVGLWSAPLAKDEAFAIQIDQTARFQLVHLKSGKSNVSKGKAAKNGDQLTLTGDDGTKIAGTFRQTSNNAFELDIAGADGKVALTLKFNKAK